MKYWQYQKSYDVTADEFINMARQNYSYNVPTFRQALRDLFRSVFRTRIINKEITDLESAIDHLEGNELLSVEKVKNPCVTTWLAYQQGHRWMMQDEPETQEEVE